jgi:hypothetical protein
MPADAEVRRCGVQKGLEAPAVHTVNDDELAVPLHTFHLVAYCSALPVANQSAFGGLCPLWPGPDAE